VIHPDDGEYVPYRQTHIVGKDVEEIRHHALKSSSGQQPADREGMRVKGR
jgi:hypothetical protein